MKKIFITYGDANYADQKERICREALATGEFDEARAYGPEFPFPDSVRPYIDSSVRGGGFWLWKPLIILDALSKADTGDIVVYSDAGSSVHPHKDWKRYFNKLKKKNVLLFRLKGKMYKWCSRKAYETLSGEKSPRWLRDRLVTAAVVMIRKDESCRLAEAWAKAATDHPEIFSDNTPEENLLEKPGFREHRHDQAVLNVLLHTLPGIRKEVAIEPARFDRLLHGGQALTLTRRSTVLHRNHKMKSKGAVSSFLIRLLNI